MRLKLVVALGFALIFVVTYLTPYFYIALSGIYLIFYLTTKKRVSDLYFNVFSSIMLLTSLVALPFVIIVFLLALAIGATGWGLIALPSLSILFGLVIRLSYLSLKNAGETRLSVVDKGITKEDAVKE